MEFKGTKNWYLEKKGSWADLMVVHPDCIQGSQFDDYTSMAQELEDKGLKLIKEATELK